MTRRSACTCFQSKGGRAARDGDSGRAAAAAAPRGAGGREHPARGRRRSARTVGRSDVLKIEQDHIRAQHHAGGSACCVGGRRRAARRRRPPRRGHLAKRTLNVECGVSLRGGLFSAWGATQPDIEENPFCHNPEGKIIEKRNNRLSSIAGLHAGKNIPTLIFFSTQTGCTLAKPEIEAQRWNVKNSRK